MTLEEATSLARKLANQAASPTCRKIAHDDGDWEVITEGGEHVVTICTKRVGRLGDAGGDRWTVVEYGDEGGTSFAMTVWFDPNTAVDVSLN